MKKSERRELLNQFKAVREILSEISRDPQDARQRAREALIRMPSDWLINEVVTG